MHKESAKLVWNVPEKHMVEMVSDLLQGTDI